MSNATFSQVISQLIQVLSTNNEISTNNYMNYPKNEKSLKINHLSNGSEAWAPFTSSTYIYIYEIEKVTKM